MINPGRYVGQSVQRREDPRLLTGRGRFIEDVVVPGMLHAAFVRSGVARGRITRLDVAEARRAPGVRAVFSAEDLNGLVHETWWSMAGPDATYPPKLCLAERDVRFVGDPIAIVLADSRYLAEDGAELVDVDIDPEDPVLDVDAAIREDSDLVHPEVGTNVPAVVRAAEDPALDEAFDRAAHVVTETFVQHRYIQVPMETRGILAEWDPYAERLTLHSSTQSAHEVRAFYARLLDLPENSVRVMTPDVGGGFGLKVFSMRDEWAVVLASTKLGRPVRWIEDRYENLVASAHARDERMTLSAAFDENGRMQAMRADHVENVGAYPYAGPATASGVVGLCLPGPYKVAHSSYSARAVYTNTCGRAPYRGPFLMETVGPEQLMDVAARKLGIDPLELRRRNALSAQDMPHTLPTTMVYDSVTPLETLEQAAKMIDYDAFRAEQRRARAEGRYLGVGISLCVEPSAFGFGGMGTEGAILRMEPSGKLHLAIGSSSTGMSVETTMMQVVADHLGCDIDDVTFTQGDTTLTPYGAGTQGSRSAVLYGNAGRQVALEIREKLLTIAAHAMEAAPEDLQVGQSRVSVKGVPTRSLPFAEIAQLAYFGHDMLPPGVSPGIEAVTRFKAPPLTFCNACHICTCEVDLATGQVRLLRYVVSEDCGQMINPKIVEGQIFGGVAQGIGGVLYEHMVYDDYGNPLASTFADYLVPTAMEIPPIECGHIESAAGNPLGVKGVGEGGAVASPAAVHNAVADALAPLGVELRGTPLGPRQILDALAVVGA